MQWWFDPWYNSVGVTFFQVYKGSGAYQKFIEVKDSVVANAGGGQLKQGPIRRPDHLRATVRWDYAPDICKVGYPCNLKLLNS